eukprot:gene8470-9961_t
MQIGYLNIKDYAKNINNDGEFVITSSKHREQKQNIGDCIEKLEKIITKASIIPKDRLPTDIPTYASEKRLKDKRARSDIKAGRQKSRLDDM